MNIGNLSAPLACVCMELFEARSLRTIWFFNLLWCRYVDDVLVGGQITETHILDKLNDHVSSTVLVSKLKEK